MPKLSGETAKKVNESESGGSSRGPLPDGRYRVRLLEVTSLKSAAQDPMWKWKFEVVDGSAPDCEGRWLWENTVLTDAALWKLNQIFAAFGVPADTDTDDLIGNTIDIQVSQTVAERGKMKGKVVNDIDQFIPAETRAAAAPAASPAAEAEVPF